MESLAVSLVNVLIGIIELTLLIGIVAAFRRRMPDLRQVALVLAVLLFAHVALMLGMVPKIPLSMNWLGKLLSIGVTIGAVAVLPSLTWRDAGFTWDQNGAARQAVVVAALVCAFVWGASIALTGFHFGPPNLEKILFEASMPGLNEEPLYRGVALVLLDRAFWGERISVAGAPIGWGAILTSAWFGIIHGNGIANGHFQVDAITILVIAVVGFGLAWIRVRTGSLAIGVIAHNLANVVEVL